MKTRVCWTMALLLVAALLALPAPALATRPEPLKIEAEMWMTGENSAAGHFSTSGLFVDSGCASEEFFIAADTIHGTKTLVGESGTIILNFQAQLTWDSPTTGEANGRWVIVSGTGAYEKLHGVGLTAATLDVGCMGPECPPNIVAKYSGKAHFD